MLGVSDRRGQPVIRENIYKITRRQVKARRSSDPVLTQVIGSLRKPIADTPPTTHNTHDQHNSILPPAQDNASKLTTQNRSPHIHTANHYSSNKNHGKKNRRTHPQPRQLRAVDSGIKLSRLCKRHHPPPTGQPKPPDGRRITPSIPKDQSCTTRQNHTQQPKGNRQPRTHTNEQLNPIDLVQAVITHLHTTNAEDQTYLRQQT